MTMFEYRELYFVQGSWRLRPYASTDSIDVNVLGHEGWELVGVAYHGKDYIEYKRGPYEIPVTVGFFKRPSPEQKSR